MVVAHSPCNGSSTNLAVADCNAWQDLYDATGGKYWTNAFRLDPCVELGRGAKCTDGHIYFMDLGGLNLYGTLPDSLGDLSQLTHLNMYGGQPAPTGGGLSGSIPDSVGKLSKLTLSE